MTNNDEIKRKFNWQSFISIGLLFSFVIMVFSGVVLYIAPEGSLSRWIGWDLLHLTKKQWEHQHTIFSYLFIIFSVFHIFKINWGYMLTYFFIEKFKMLNVKELMIAMLITVFVFTGTLLNFYPFKTILRIGNKISGNYAKNVDMPEITDAEKLSLSEFSQKVFNIQYDELKVLLKGYDFENINYNSSVKEFCLLNDISPEKLYVFIKKTLSIS